VGGMTSSRISLRADPATVSRRATWQDALVGWTTHDELQGPESAAVLEEAWKWPMPKPRKESEVGGLTARPYGCRDEGDRETVSVGDEPTITAEGEQRRRRRG